MKDFVNRKIQQIDNQEIPARPTNGLGTTNGQEGHPAGVSSFASPEETPIRSSAERMGPAGMFHGAGHVLRCPFSRE